MTLSEMLNYDLDAFSLGLGFLSAFLFAFLSKSIVQVIRLIINFIKWLIKRKDDKND